MYALTAPHDVILMWRDSKQDRATTRRLGNTWIDFYKARVLPGNALPEKEDMTRNSVHACFTNNCTAYHDKALASAGFP